MKRNLLAGLSILAVVAGVGWKLASHPESSADLQQVSLSRSSEHSQPSSTTALGRIRIRLSPSDSGYQITATTHHVPQISVAAD